MLDVKITPTTLKVAYKNKPNEAPILEGKWNSKVNATESFWNIERDGDKSTLNVTLEK